MRSKMVLIVAFASFITPAFAAGADDKACILKAAETLPKIPGLMIKASRATAMPAPAGWSAAGPPLRVEVDIVAAAGQAATYAYLCAVGAQGAIVQRLAN
jgi:hypothetical protein